jgi:hypothetical protein
VTLSKTAALKGASRFVGDIIRQSNTSYVFYAPYREPGGPTTEVRAHSYWLARRYRTTHLVATALSLMGVKDVDLGHERCWESSIDWEIERAQEYLGIGTAKGILNHVLLAIPADARESAH